ncbi:hypothetical protein [Clostridium sp. UBA5119]|uniref:hypothetical protein n=1 Tax=Clostridium sp. UBA5119 TaxID=1946366 RepID=UPI003217B1E5
MKLFKKGNYISSRELYTILIFCSIIFIITLYNPLYNMKSVLNLAINGGYELSNFDILHAFNGWGLISKSSYIILIIPIFSALIIYIVDYNNSLIRRIRYKSRNRIWNKNITLILISAFLLSTLLVIGGYLISGVFVKGYNNTWNTELGLPYLTYGNTEIWNDLSNLLVTYKVLLVFWITTFFGLSFIGIFICTFQLFMRNVYVYLMVLTIVLVEVCNLFNFKLLESIVISPNKWVNPNRLIASNIYFLVGFLLLYFWGRYINSERDEGLEKKY